jgi:phenylpropionate dioxygenase-like ring-hydroxylating dioxygenase large terminal subunit
MNQDWQRTALEALFSGLERKVQGLADGATTIPVDTYLSAARLDAERALFRRHPIVIGAASQLQKPGDFVTHDALGVPLLAARDGTGRLNGFINVCRHRGARLMQAPCGSGHSTFVCRYHGWSYGLDGRLRGVSHPSGFPDLDRSQRGLAPLRVFEQAGLLFAQLASEEGQAFEAQAQPLFAELQTFGLGSRHVFCSSTRVIGANWKLMVETMLETYHIATLHEQTAASAFEDNFMAFETLGGPNGRFAIPFKGAARPRAGEDDDWQLLFHAALVYWIFPNTFIFMFGPFVHVISIYPETTSKCTVTSTALIDPSHVDEPRREAFRLAYDSYWQTIDEDVAIVESVQAGLSSGANRELLIGRYEHHIKMHFHDVLQRLLE